MKKRFRGIPILQWGAFLAADIAAILQILAMIFDYEKGSNYFSNNASLPIVAVIFALIALLAGSVSAFINKPEASSELEPRFRALHYSPAIGFLCALTGIVYELTQRALTLWEKHTDSQQFLAEYLNDGQTKISLLCVLLLILAVVYCILWTRRTAKSNPNRVVCFGFAAVIGCALLSIHLYFDMSIEMNAPVKAFLQAGCLCSMILFTTELRLLLKKSLPKLLLIISVLVITATSLTALPVSIAYLIGKIDRFPYFTYALFMLSMIPVAVGHIVAHSFQSTPKTDILKKTDPLDPNAERTSV